MTVWTTCLKMEVGALVIKYNIPLRQNVIINVESVCGSKKMATKICLKSNAQCRSMKN